MESRTPQRPPLRSKTNSSTTSTIPESNPISYTPKCTAEEYVNAIAYHSQQSSAQTLYPGDTYHGLWQFFKQKPYVDASATESFAWLISPGDQQTSSDSSKSKGQFEGFADRESCLEAIRKNVEMSHPQMLFLRGHPSPDWISNIGAFCYADPELFRWFLRYRAEPRSDCYFESAPSIMSNIFRFKFFTIGSKSTGYRSSQEEVDGLRLNAANKFQKYQTGLRVNPTRRLGESIVRNFYVLDERHCVIEQEIVVSILDIGKTWMAIACTDAGNDLTKEPRFPCLGTNGDLLSTRLLPIIQYKPRCALKSRSINGTTMPNSRPNVQSLAIFPEGYGQSLDWSLAKSDRFHLLSDMFKLAAFSQKQLLNLIREKIMTETNQLSLSSENPTLANLLYFRDILEDQLSNASYMLQLTNEQNKIFRNGRRSNSRLSNDQRNTADHSATEILSLFQDIHAQAESLHQKCTEGMTVISNNTMLAESRRAMQQAKLVTKLTLVAFVYLPFSFTAGFFGMNFTELGTGTIPLWIFFAASFPLMIITMLFFLLDVQTIKRALQSAQLVDQDRI